MNLIDQHSALKSIDRALIPSLTMIDGRSEIDYLDFLVNFSTLINFYDSSNTISSNWQPFLLKDSVFLTAAISKIRYTQMYALFTNSNLKLQAEINSEGEALSDSFNHLLDQLTYIFVLIEQWTYYMEKSANEYNLKTYLISEIRFKYAQYFWAILSLRQTLVKTKDIPDITPPYSSRYKNFSQKIWQESKNQRPFWEVLNLNYKPNKNKLNVQEVFDSLKNTGNLLFDLLKIVIKAAREEFSSLKVQRSNFPDTILLRAFVKLLSIQTAELNRISKKHLNFNFEEILKQRLLPASPDSVFACIDLAEETPPFKLPKGTLFDAGININDEPVNFQTIKDVELNPANIVSVFTLSKEKTKNGYRLFKEEIGDPGTVRRDESGKIQVWDTFGRGFSQDAQLATFGFAFASPMLLLREGNRTLEIIFEFDNSTERKLFKRAKYFLSTQDKWIRVKPVKSNPTNKGTGDSLTLSFILDPTIPPIEAFLESPDGYNSVWPMFRTQFSWFPDDQLVPIAKSLTINVSVDSFQNLQLYNVDGSLTTTAPFQILGATPMPGSNFIVGSSEIFSKPITCLDLNFQWDNLPFVPTTSNEPIANFETYYDIYNEYINGDLNNETDDGNDQDTSASPSKPQKKLLDSITNIFSSKSKTEGSDSEKENDSNEDSNDNVGIEKVKTTFNNSSFKVDFSVLQNQKWTPVKVSSEEAQKCIKKIKEELSIPDEIVDNNPSSDELLNLYDESKTDILGKKEVLKYRFFNYTESDKDKIIPDPYLQLEELELTDSSAYGFLKMTLTEPNEGFGFEIYGQVVSAVALENAERLIGWMKPKGEKPELLDAPNPPFVPKAESFTASYKSSIKYDLNKKRESYPLQWFYQTPFQNYMIYDSNEVSTNLPDTESGVVDSITLDFNRRLYPNFNFDGELFLEIENLVAPNEINLDFQLASKFSNLEKGEAMWNPIHYHYLSDKGWKKLPVLSDGTHSFSCSGILNFNVLSDISQEHIEMPGNNYWISIGVKDDPKKYAQTAFLKSNGIELVRTGADFLDDNIVPRISSDTIIGPVEEIPQIASIVQPFPSFGGRAAEDDNKMYRRVSTRIKSKDRVVSTTDYYRTILEAFLNIYYAKVLTSKNGTSSLILLVKKVDDWTDASAFQPFVSKCELLEVEKYLTERASAFANFQVSNFQLEKIVVKAIFSVANGYEFEGVASELNDALNIFLSPWIESSQPQIKIDQGINKSEVEGFIANFPGVFNVVAVSISSETKNGNKPLKENGQIYSPSENALFVPAEKHNLKPNPV